MEAVSIPRRASSLVEEFLKVFRVVVLDGPRQAGKTTILRELCHRTGRAFVSLDDPAELAAAMADPMAYLEGFRGPVAIDEFQRAGDELLLTIKLLVDRSNRRGQFLLAGSTNFLTNERLSDSLAGRVGIVPVRPLTRGEVLRARETFVERVVADPRSAGAIRADSLSRVELAELVTVGGFPESVLSPSSRARSLFFESYLSTVISRESIADAGSGRDPFTLRRVLQAVSARTAGELNIADLAADLGSTRDTVNAHLSLLATLHQVVMLPAWASSAATRAKRRPKIIIGDSGTASSLLGTTAVELADPRNQLFGPLLETYVLNELLRQCAWSEQIQLGHYRDRDGREVDVVIESPSGVVGVEIKAAARVDTRAANHLLYFASRVGRSWRGGVVLHPGSATTQLADRVWAVPLASLWSPD